MKYEQLGAGWQDKKYNEFGVVVRDYNKALNDILVIMLQTEKCVDLLAKGFSEYEGVQLYKWNICKFTSDQKFCCYTIKSRYNHL